jgi:antitoxin (DNA-binding transcriptional repressor) of toxin-antitoxin stability system
MKTASVRDLRQNFPRVMAWIEEGEQVAVTMHRKVIARLIPEKPPEPKSPDFKARFGKPTSTAVGKMEDSAVTLLSQDRGA